MANFMDHLADDVLPPLLDKLAANVGEQGREDA
jgi:hypothetical protein